MGLYSSISDRIDEICQNIDVEAIARAAEAGDRMAFDLLDRTGIHVGVAVATLVNLLNPGMVIIGGGVAQAGEILLTPVKRTVKKCAIGMISQTVTIQQDQMGKYAGVIGGAAAIFDKKFR